MKKLKKFAILRLFIMSIILLGQVNFSINIVHALTIKNRTPNIENIRDRNVQNKKISNLVSLDQSSIVTPLRVMSSRTLSKFSLVDASPSVTFGPNLILNSNLQNITLQGGPANWNKGGYGSNTRTFIYPINLSSSTNAIAVNITNYASGDAKWYFDDVPVTTGDMYQFSDLSKSDAIGSINVRYKMNDGTYTYGFIANVDSSNEYINNTTQISVPLGAISVTIFHVIQSNGTLNVQNYSLNKITINNRGQSNSTNLTPNSNFILTGSDETPLSWHKGGYATNTRVFSYTDTQNGSKAISINIKSYTSGDAKWYFDPVQLSPGTYNYSDDYIASVPSVITIQFKNSDGTYSYKDIAHLAATDVVTNTSTNFIVNAGVQNVTIFHIIKSVGTLKLNNPILSAVPINLSSVNKLATANGMVTFRFDDGWLSQYQNAIPKLNSAGIKGTFYIVSQQIYENGFTNFMSNNQIEDIYSMGHEIGAHTKTHPHLSQLSSQNQQSEIEGSRSDLISLNVGPVSSFAYPYGDYSTTTIQLVKNAGFTSAGSTIDSYVTVGSDKYQLENQSALLGTTLAEYEQWIDTAQATKTWVIITFHKVDNSGDMYSVTPDLFNKIVDYVVSKNIKTTTVSDGINYF